MADQVDDNEGFRFRYVRQQSIAVVFFSNDEDADLRNLLDLRPDDEKIALTVPRNIRITASTMGLILGLPYTVFNPLVGEANDIPTPMRYHAEDNPRALIVCNDAFHPGTYLFFIICIVPSATSQEDYPTSEEGSSISEEGYCFDVYSSSTKLWSCGEDYFLGHVRTETTVSCGTRAYWITDMEDDDGKTPTRVVSYDISTSSVSYYDLPQNFLDIYYGLQLGTWGQDLLMLIASTDTELKVYTLQELVGEPAEWQLNLSQVFSPGPIIPLKSQTWGRPQVLFLVQGTLHLWEIYWDWRQQLSPDHFPQMPSSSTLRFDDILNAFPYVDFRFNAIEDFPSNSDTVQPSAILTSLDDIGIIPPFSRRSTDRVRQFLVSDGEINSE